MPTYEYLCRSCGDRLEVVQSFSDDPLTVCGSCGGELRKVFSAAGLIFKGSGWHVKDYASGSTSSSGSTPSGGSASTSTSTGGGTGSTSEGAGSGGSGGTSSGSAAPSSTD